MNYDLFAEFTATDENKIGAICNGNYESQAINNVHTRLKLLTGAIPYGKDDAKAAYKKIVHERKKYNDLIVSELDRMESLKIKDPQININSYPYFSFYLAFKFTLAKPYLSKDDDVFYPCENPIRKDKVFKVPMVSPSSWKGNLRWTVRQINPSQPDSEEIIRLFGNEKRKESGLRKGRLNFFPTYFDRIGLEVINPHSRATKAGTNPIYIESVPEGAPGTFSLLYVPFDLIGRQEPEVKEQVKRDLEIIFDSLENMLLTYGFSAKKGSGFGVVDKNIKGEFEMSHVPLFRDRPVPNQLIDKSNPFSKLAILKVNNMPEKVKDNIFSNFDELKGLMDKVKAEGMKNA